MSTQLIRRAFRHLYKEISYTVACSVGLSLAFTTLFYALSFLMHEYNNDNHFASSEYTFQLKSNPIYETAVSFNSLPVSNHDYLKEYFPEIEVAVPIFQDGGSTIEIKIGEKVFLEEKWAYTSTDIPTLFNESVFEINSSFEPGTVILSISLASKLFGNTQVYDEVLTLGEETYTIAGQFKDFPTNSQLDVDLFICPLHQEKFDYPQGKVYVKVAPTANIDLLNSKIDENSANMARYLESIRYHLVSVKDIYHGKAYDDKIARFANHEMLDLLLVISLIILFVATFNIMTLSQVKAIYRSKEIGMKKILGISKGQLYLQFVIEAAIIVSISWALSITAIQLTNQYYTAYLEISLYYYPIAIAVLLLISIIVIGLMALTQNLLFVKVNPRQVVNGTFKVGEKKWVLKSLIIAQFIISTTLIGGAILVDKQIEYIISKPLGFNIENLWFIRAESDKINLRLLKPKIDAIAQIESSSISTGLPFVGHGGLIDDSKGTIKFIPFIDADKDFVNTLQIPFAEKSVGEFTNGVIVNMKASRDEDLDLGKFTSKNKIGVVYDFHLSSLASPIAPLIITIGQPYAAFLTFRLTTQNVDAVLQSIIEQCGDLYPNWPIEIVPLKEKYLSAHKSALQLSSALKTLSLIAIFISCLGLISITGLSIRKKLKEIAIRKVLGASIFQILRWVNSGYLTMIVFSVVVSGAISYFYGNKWLASFSYAIQPNILIFVSSGIIVFIISITILLYQSWRTANNNPVEVLKSE